MPSIGEINEQLFIFEKNKFNLKYFKYKQYKI